MTDARQTTVRDYLEILRASRLLVAAAVTLAIGASVGLSLNQPKQYQSTASLVFEDVSQDLALVGASGGSGELPAARTLRESRTLLRTEVLEDAMRLLRFPTTLAELRSEISATPENTSNLVLVTAQARSAQRSAAIANAVARAAVTRATRETREGFRNAATDLRKRFSTLSSKDRADAGTRNLYNDRISRLDALASVSSPVKLAESASVPTGAFSPRPVRSGVIAGLLGLLVGVGAAFLRNGLDRRLRGPDEIREHLGIPMLGHVRQDAMGRAGLSDAGRGPLAAVDLEGFRILRANLEFLEPDRGLKVVVVTSCLPGEGKTTVAASLAYASAIAGQRTLLLECDLRRPTLAGRLGAPAGPGLADLLTGEATMREVVRQIVHDGTANGDRAAPRSHDTGRLDAILAGSSTAHPAELLGSTGFQQFITQAKTRYDAVIIDSPPLLPVADTRALMQLSDAALLCVRVSQTTRDQARAGRDILLNMEEYPVALIVTGLTAERGQAYGYYAEAYSYESR